MSLASPGFYVRVTPMCLWKLGRELGSQLPAAGPASPTVVRGPLNPAPPCTSPRSPAGPGLGVSTGTQASCPLAPPWLAGDCRAEHHGSAQGSSLFEAHGLSRGMRVTYTLEWSEQGGI